MKTPHLGASGAALLLAVSLLSGANHPLEIQRSDRAQQIEGWGACMIYWSLSSTPYWDPRWRQAYRDLGFNIVRVDMQREVLIHPSGNHATPVEMSEDIAANAALMDFSVPASNVYGDMAAWLAENALEPERVRITGSLWSPPHWMKGPTGNSASHVNGAGPFPTPWLQNGTSGDSIGGRLLKDEDTLEQFGLYLVSWLHGFKEHFGVPIYAFSIQNESAFENPFDSCTYIVDENGERDFNEYAKALKGVKDVFDRYEVDAKIMGPHMAYVGRTPSDPFGMWVQMGMINGVKNHPDPTLIDFIDIYNSNDYQTANVAGAQSWDGYWRGAQEVDIEWGWIDDDKYEIVTGLAADNKPTWVSEAGSGDNNLSGAMRLATQLQVALILGNVSAYVHWQMSDTGGNANTHTLLGKNDLDDPEQSIKYSAFKQFSRYIRPGARRITARFSNGEATTEGSRYDVQSGLTVSAYEHRTDRRGTLVILNRSGSTHTVEFNLPERWEISRMQTFRTSSNERFDNLGDTLANGGTVSISVPNETITTLTAELGPRVDPTFDEDGDGLGLGLENYFGRDELTPEPEPIAIAFVPTPEAWEILYARAEARTENAVVARSGDLALWDNENVGEPSVQSTADGFESILQTVAAEPEASLWIRFEPEI